MTAGGRVAPSTEFGTLAGVKSRLHYLPAPAALNAIDAKSLRESFLLGDLFAPGEVRTTFTDLDRMAIGAACPTHAPLDLPDSELTGHDYFHAMRESGVLNLGGRAAVEVDGKMHTLNPLDCLYIGRGSREIRFHPSDGDSPAAFHLLSCPAHADYPTTLIERAKANRVELGEPAKANVRTIFQYIHEGGAQSAQLVIGYTELAEGSVWNTFPPHTHSRRCEVYTYFDVGDTLVMHFMGEPAATRHLVVREKQTVLSPPWSIHCGCGTGAYKFLWAMAGENKAFADMDAVDPGEMA